jgi:hypothetical protein
MKVKTYLTLCPRVAWAVRNLGPLALMLGLTSILCAAANPPTLVVQWNNAALQGVRDSSFGPPMIARALASVQGNNRPRHSVSDREGAQYTIMLHMEARQLPGLAHDRRRNG